MDEWDAFPDAPDAPASPPLLPSRTAPQPRPSVGDARPPAPQGVGATASPDSGALVDFERSLNAANERGATYDELVSIANNYGRPGFQKLRSQSDLDAFRKGGGRFVVPNAQAPVAPQGETAPAKDDNVMFRGIPMLEGDYSLPSLGRGLAEGVGDIVQGAGDFVGMFSDPFARLLSDGAGYDPAQFRTLGTVARDGASLPQSSDPYVRRVNEFAAGGLLGGAAARGLSTLASPGMTQHLLSVVGQSPIRDTAAGAGAGIGATLGEDMGGTPGQLVGILAGGFGGYGAADMAMRLGGSARGTLGASRGAVAANAEPAPNSSPISSPVSSPVPSAQRDALIAAAKRAKQAANESAPEVPQMGAVRPLASPMSKAELLASASRVQPRDMLPIAGNSVEAGDLAAMNKGRFGVAKPVDERGALTRGSVTNWRGESVPKVGPLDMVGFLRTQGGIREQGGGLAQMGLNNAARRGMDHVGQEARFGPLVDEEGMNLDDAAFAAWEAGYFPELAERPDINTFLDALRETYNAGAGRRFRADDYAQLETYDAMRAERYDVERAMSESGGPIYVDKSVPADDQPFPPVEAYQEWPSEAVQRVGNIDVSRLETPQDIGRALTQTYNTLGGFDDATRGRIAQAETERLASELNMRPDDLLARRQGQAFNAEEALAARQILAKSANELVNAAKRVSGLDDPGDELLTEFRQKWMRHVAIQEQVAGITAEAGRVLNQFKMAADARAVRGDVLTAFVRAGGGKDDLQEAANALLDAVEKGPGHFNTLAAQAAKPKFRDKISELYINSLLSNPPTHIVNMVSSALSAVGQIPEYAVGSAIGGARRAMLGEETGERILTSEVGARAFGLLQGIKEGAALFAKTLRTGEPDDFASKVEGDQFRAISGLKGEVVRIPTRFLTAEDQFFKGIARRMELNAQAVRIASREGLKGQERAARVAELSGNPTDEMLERAFDYGRYLTFQQKLGAIGQGVTRITSDSLAAKVVVPFVRTPINLLKFATERSPAAPFLKEWRADFMAGGERRDMAIARSMVGSGFGALFYQMALDGQITGAVPPDPAKAKLLYADGWQPYSLKVGDSYISYSRLDPIATTLGVAADMATLPQGMSDRQKDDQSTMLVASIMNNLANKTWLSGVSSLVEGLSDPQRNAGNWLERTLSSFAVPAIVGGAARQIDPVARRRDSVSEAIQARIPGLSDNLLPRRDVFGEPVPIDSVGPDFLSPFSQSKARNDPVVAEMMRIGKSVSAPGKQFTEDGERLDYAPEQYDRYHEIAGRLTYNRLLGLIGSEDYTNMDDAAKRKAAAKAIASARKSARELLKVQDFKLPARGEVADGNDPWGAFPDAGRASSARSGGAAGDAWGNFPDAEQRDVLGTLQRAVPGVSITSGFRTPEYQNDMRRRGYTPAKDSAHLDGSALDLVPPAGMSMRQLMERVQAVEPGARMLPEGDHLHVTFPDWQGAPALGGAATAGVRNPVGSR